MHTWTGSKSQVIISLQKQILKTPLAAVEQQKYSVIQFYLMVPYCKSNSSGSLLLFGSI